MGLECQQLEKFLGSCSRYPSSSLCELNTGNEIAPDFLHLQKRSTKLTERINNFS